jgi:hypothetical protein
MIELLNFEPTPARHLVIAFAGVRQRFGGIPFEFHKSLGSLDCSAMFVRDTEPRWYQYSGAEISTSIERIRAAVKETGAVRVICLGNSMGGYGALLFGALCNADAIVSFAPQSAIDPAILHELGDTRFDAFTRAIPAFPFGDLLRITPASGQVVTCFGDDEPLDRVHAERLRPTWNCEQIVVPNSGHDVAAKLKERGELLPMLSRIIAGESPYLLMRAIAGS